MGIESILNEGDYVQVFDKLEGKNKAIYVDTIEGWDPLRGFCYKIFELNYLSKQKECTLIENGDCRYNIMIIFDSKNDYLNHLKDLINLYKKECLLFPTKEPKEINK